MRRREVDEPTREMLLRAFADTPPEFDDALRSTLTRLQSEKEEKTVKRKLSMAPVLAFVIVMILAVVAVAAALLSVASCGNSVDGPEGTKTLQTDGIRITWIQDNAKERLMERSLFPDASDSLVASLGLQDGIPSTVSVFLVETDGKKILFDTGNGTARGGKLVGGLVQPLVAFRAAHDDAAGIEVVVKGLALAQEFG